HGDQLIRDEIGFDARDRVAATRRDRRHQRSRERRRAIALHEHALDRDAAGRRLEQVADRRADIALGQLPALGPEDRSDRMRAHRLAARAVALPLAVRRVEDHYERRGSPGYSHLELDLAIGSTSADDAVIAGKCDSLRPGALGRLLTNRIAQS